MFGSYLAFEVEAERRREVLANSMREARGDRRAAESPRPETRRPIGAPVVPGLAEIAARIAATLLNRVRQRA